MNQAIIANITIRDKAVYTIDVQFNSFYEEWKTFIWMCINFVENFRVETGDKIRK